MQHKILKIDPYLKPFAKDFDLRQENYKAKKAELLSQGQTLCEFANAHHYFGFHPAENGWVYREWAPAADKLYITGDFCNWERYACPMKKLSDGIFEVALPHTLQDNTRVMTVVVSQGQELERIPVYIRQVRQEENGTWNGIFLENKEFLWTDQNFKPKKELFIYECHIGMAQEEGKIGSYREFTQNILPRIKKLGYNTIQIMAIMEHPYYASFGYQVTNFFAPSSRFGTPEELKALINTAHKMGITVLLDVVHSHACKNTREGINEFDGTSYQFFHEGEKGEHSACQPEILDGRIPFRRLPV